MSNIEQIEKVRQEIMRFRELLNLMRGNLDEGERAYTKLFAALTPESLAQEKEKDRQWTLAEQMVSDGDFTALSKVAMQMRFHARTLEREFETLHDIIGANEEAGSTTS
jgi:hypothetical protein